MAARHSVLVAGVGARTAVGMNAAGSAAAVRAGIAGFHQHPFMVDAAGKKMIVARAPYLDADLAGQQRFSQLAAAAVAETIAALGALVTAPVPVFIGLPPERPGRPRRLDDVAAAVVREIEGRGIKIATLEAIECGHAAGALAIRRAWQVVASGAADIALAGGVDSYLEPETLEWLEVNDQLHSAGKENNPYGFVPGEAAGFVWLAAPQAMARSALPIVTEVVATASALETRLVKTDAVCTGEAMTELFRSLAEEPIVYRADHLYCDMNGEPYRADEFGFAVIRAGELLVDPHVFTAPADCWGDVGAASGPLYLMLADRAARKGYAAGPIQAAFTSSESGERCGFVTRTGAW